LFTLMLVYAVAKQHVLAYIIRWYNIQYI
jgi:hypothetical protein